MIDDHNLQAFAYVSGDDLTAQELVEMDQSTRSRRLMGVAVLVFLLVVGVIVYMPSLLDQLQLQQSVALPTPVLTPKVASGPVPPVPILWERLDFITMPESSAQNLKSGKYYYDFRFPGNFGMAISYWKQALARLQGTSRDAVQDLVTSAEGELARQFSADSADAFVLLKQGKRDQAVALLEKMRADYLDIRARQYVWTSIMLARRRR